jgi:hypothetical protein
VSKLTGFRRAFPIAAIFLLCILGFSTASAQNLAEERLKHLVVMISSGQELGAGIIFGQKGNLLYIVTANHVVRPANGSPNARIKVEFYDNPGENIQASLLNTSKNLDIAVLSVSRADVGAIPFDQLGDPASIGYDSEVRMVGYIEGVKWNMNLQPDRVDAIEADTIHFQSFFIDHGASGGPLLDNRYQVIGMVESKSPLSGKATRIDSIIAELRFWRYPVSLGAPATLPRAGGSTISSQVTFNESLDFAKQFPNKTLAFADFTSEDISGTNLQVLPDNGFGYNQRFLHSWVINLGGGGFTARFRVPASGPYILLVTHQASCVPGSRGDGYSPVTIKLNSHIVADHYDPASAHGGSHRMVTDRWPIVANAGQNELQWTAGQAISANYWIQSIVVASVGVVPLESPAPIATCTQG